MSKPPYQCYLYKLCNTHALMQHCEQFARKSATLLVRQYPAYVISYSVVACQRQLFYRKSHYKYSRNYPVFTIYKMPCIVF